MLIGGPAVDPVQIRNTGCLWVKKFSTFPTRRCLFYRPFNARISWGDKRGAPECQQAFPDLIILCMNTNVRFCRVVIAASLGAVLWAACSSPEQRFSQNSSSKPFEPVEFEETAPAETPIREFAGVQRNNFDDLEAYRKRLIEETVAGFQLQ